MPHISVVWLSFLTIELVCSMYGIVLCPWVEHTIPITAKSVWSRFGPFCSDQKEESSGPNESWEMRLKEAYQ